MTLYISVSCNVLGRNNVELSSWSIFELEMVLFDGTYQGSSRRMSISLFRAKLWLILKNQQAKAWWVDNQSRLSIAVFLAKTRCGHLPYDYPPLLVVWCRAAKRFGTAQVFSNTDAGTVSSFSRLSWCNTYKVWGRYYRRVKKPFFSGIDAFKTCCFARVETWFSNASN